jgi:hypothetical protein
MDDMSQMGGIDMLRDHLTGKKLREKREKREQPKGKGQRNALLPSLPKLLPDVLLPQLSPYYTLPRW